MKIFTVILCLIAAILHHTSAVAQKSEDQVIKDIISIESSLYQNPIDAKLRLQKLIKNNPDVSDSTKSLLYLKWGITLAMTNKIDSAVWAVRKSYQVSNDENLVKGSALKTLAILYRLKGNYKEAEKALIESLKLNRDNWKDPTHEVVTLQEYGSLCLDQYDYARAISLYLQALDTLQSCRFINSKKPLLTAKLRVNLGEAYMASENYKMAIREFKVSIPILDSLQDIEGLVLSCHVLANAYISSKLYYKADSLLNLVYPLTKKLENDELKAFILLAMANSLVAQGKPDPALSNFRQAFAIMNKNSSASILDCVSPYLKLLVKTGAETEAKQLMSNSSVQTVLSNALPKDLLEFRKNEIQIIWKNMTVNDLNAYYQDLIQLADTVYQDEKDKSALQAQAKYQFERQKEIEEHLLAENSLLRAQEKYKKIQLILSIAIGLLITFVLLLNVKRLQMITRQQTMEIALNEGEIKHHKESREWAERERALKEKLIEQQKNIISKAIEDADMLRAEMEKIVKEQKQPKREELLAQFELIKKENLGIDLLITQFNALHPLYTQTLIKRFPKLSQADLQFCIFLRMNLTTKEISSLLNIEPRSIYIKKYRVMEKMGLLENDDFEKILYGIG